jgi:hypothetical protein
MPKLINTKVTKHKGMYAETWKHNKLWNTTYVQKLSNTTYLVKLFYTTCVLKLFNTTCMHKF